VLYALEKYPQLSQAYIRAEIACARRWGAHVEVWSQGEPPSPYPSAVPVHRGSLAEAIERVSPQVVHVHWLHSACEFRHAVGNAGLPLTVRGHNFDHADERVGVLNADPTVRGIYLFPHFAATLPASLDKVRPLPVAFDPALYHPGPRQDRRLVFRAAPSLPAKDLELFLHVAQRLPSRRYVLAVARTPGNYADTLAEYNRTLANPVDLRINLSHEEVAAISKQSAIYLHTDALTEPFGMPVSIAEAMATGNYIVARRSPACEAFVGDAGSLYDTEDEAEALLRETESWSDERWERARRTAIERANRHFAGDTALRPLFDDWARFAAPSTRLD
jgi:glycosyltransferase involved in cell wall biosynthesis